MPGEMCNSCEQARGVVAGTYFEKQVDVLQFDHRVRFERRKNAITPATMLCCFIGNIYIYISTLVADPAVHTTFEASLREEGTGEADSASEMLHGGLYPNITRKTSG